MKWLMMAAFVVAWSSGFVGATLAEGTGASMWALLSWRYLATAGILVPTCLLAPSVRRAGPSVGWRDVVHQVTLGALSHVVFLGGVFLAARQGLDAGLSALVCALQPLLVTGAGRVFFSDRVRATQWAGLGVALVGVALSMGGITAAGAGSVGLVVASLLGLSTAALLERHWRPTVPMLLSLTIQVCVAAATFVAIALSTDGLHLPVTEPMVLAVVWLVLLSGLGGYATFTWCLRHVGATTTSTLLYLTAPVTMLWAWAMFGQHPSAIQGAGLAVVLGGVFLASSAAHTRRQQHGCHRRYSGSL